jgi:streptogramin lyase
MSLDQRLREGLQGLDALERAPFPTVIDAVLDQGRRRRWVRRITVAGVALAAAVAGLVIGPDVLDRSSDEPRPALPATGGGTITTVVGTGARWTSGDGGPATEAEIEYPIDLAFDGQGNLYVLEHGNPPFVRKVDTDGNITSVVGPGAPGEAGHLSLARTFSPSGLAVDPDGNVYIGGGDGPDFKYRVIRVDRRGGVTTVAGTGERGFSGDGGPATEATLTNVWDVALDVEGNLYIAGSNRIRKVSVEGVITTIVGTGRRGFSGDGGPAVEAQTSGITGVATDASGNVYFIDYRNRRIRRIGSDGIITTIAGGGTRQGNGCFFGDSVPATQAVFCGPEHLSVDSSGNVYIADTYSHRIRMIDTRDVITTVAGSGVDSYSGDSGSATEASLSEPSSVAIGPDGAIYIADSGNDRVRKVVR